MWFSVWNLWWNLKKHNGENHPSKLPDSSLVHSRDDEEIVKHFSDDESEYNNLAFYYVEYTPKVSNEQDTSGISFKRES